MAKFTELEFINMTNQSTEEKRERISKIRAVMMKNSHRERRLAKGTCVDVNKTTKTPTTPMTPESPLRHHKLRASRKSTSSKDSSVDSVGSRKSLLHSDISIITNATHPERVLSDTDLETNYGVPVGVLRQGSVIDPTPEMLEGVRFWLDTNFKVADEGNIIQDCFLGYCRERETIAGPITISSIVLAMLAFGDVTSNHPLGPAVSRQYSQSIKLLNKALRRPETATHYAVITAITGLMSLFFVMDSPTADYDMHERGVHKIVQFRGGLDSDMRGTVALKSLQVLSAMRRLAGVAQMKNNNYTPAFQFTRPTGLDEYFPPSYRHFTLCTLKSEETFLRQDPSISTVLNNLHELVYLAENLNGDSQSLQYQAIERWENAKWNALCSRGLDNPATSIPRHKPESYMLEAYRVASIIFVSFTDPTVLCLSPNAAVESWRSDNYLADLVLSLRNNISATDVSSFWSPLPGALLWCLIIGSVAASRLGDPFANCRAWFRLELLRVVVAYSFSRGEPARIASESLEKIVNGIEAASYLSGAYSTNHQGWRQAALYPEHPRLMMDQF